MKILKYFLYTSKVWLVATIIPTLLIINFAKAVAQQITWSKQERVPEYYDLTEEPPYLIADQNHVIHAFNAQPVDLSDNTSQKAIFYRQWNLKNGWSIPNDIFFSEIAGNIELVDIGYDQNGIVHVLIQMNNGEIYYSQSYLSTASSPASWMDPFLVSPHSRSISQGFEKVGAIAVDADGEKILAIYGSVEEGSGLYFILSTDGGSNWSTPYPIYLSPNQELVVTDPDLILSDSGIFHAVWSTFDQEGSAGPGYYARFDPESRLWSNPIELDDPGIRTPSIFETGSNIFISYYHIKSNGNWWRRSINDGQTWILPEQVSPIHVGTNGGLSFVVDSSETLHAFFGERIDDNNHGMWHITWLGNSWSNPEAVVKGPQIRDVTGGSGFDPRSARAVISNGNLILVSWGTDGAGGVNGAWYSYKILDTPELPSQPLIFPAEPPAINTEKMASTATSVVTSTAPIVAVEIDQRESNFSLNPQFPFITGIIPVIVFLAALVVVKALLSSKIP